jgi:archaellum component FlaG (FlaF/FlaG flagellin family)
MIRFLGFLFLFLYSLNLLAQDDYSYVGAIKLNDTSFISYKLDFIEKDGLITGYSTTDIGGAHETKSYISGFFDDNANTLNFYESGILYTKSKITKNDFCFVHFDGRLRKMNENQKVEGSFKGLYSDGKECIHGEIILSNYKKVLKRTKKMDKKINRSIFVSKEKKEKIDLVKMMDSLSLNIIKKNEVLSVFSSSKTVQLTLYDAGQEDGDLITILVNGRIILKDYAVTTAKETLSVSLDNPKTVIKVIAVNNGSVGGNTVKIDISDGTNTIETLTNLKAKETASFAILRKD